MKTKENKTFELCKYFFQKIICLFEKSFILCIKIINIMASIATKSAEELIVEHLENNGQKMSWLADKIGLTAGHLHSVLKGENYTKRELTDENLKKINETLGTKFKK